MSKQTNAFQKLIHHIHKVIAVSNSGFSRAAKLKAEANGIDLKTIDEALQINFGEEFRKLKLTDISHFFELKTATISFNPPSKKKPTPRTLVYDDGCADGNLEELTKLCYEEGTKKKLTSTRRGINAPCFWAAVLRPAG